VLVAIVGRPNVGKSTLFNRLTGSRQAIVEDTPGVTRDRVYGEAEWEGHTIPLVDTGGYVPRSDDPYERAIREQAEIALEDADVILFVVDVTTGITEMDKEIATVLRPTETPVMVVANKADNEGREWDASEFYQLGLGEVFPVSSTNKRGVDDMMAALVEELPGTEDEADEDRVRISLVGKPNAGKSSLVNATLGFDRAIVTEKPGTTRDTVQSLVQYEDRELMLVDTAGMRKRAKTDGVEFYATVRSERAIRAGDVCVLVLDATEELHTRRAWWWPSTSGTSCPRTTARWTSTRSTCGSTSARSTTCPSCTCRPSPNSASTNCSTRPWRWPRHGKGACRPAP
jgi:GTP-binding protein